MKKIFIATILLITPKVFAQVEVYDEVDTRALPAQQQPPPREQAPQPVGKKSADQYFVKRQKVQETSASTDRYLMLQMGGFFNEEVYKWGKRNDEAGKFVMGVTYRVGEWVNSMDLMLRADLMWFDLNEGKAMKLALMPAIVFPDASSRFPMYFGAGIGPGIFFKQIKNESALSLDYQLFAGARFFDLFQNVGFVVEAGMKNHFLVFSDGQFNSVFVTVGAVFTF